jgi:uncharacterized membrane protein
MISNHYPLLFATRFNWLIVAIVLAVGPIIRHFYNSRHEGKGSPWWTWAVAAAGMIAVGLLSAAGPREIKTSATPPKANIKTVENIVISRCSMCHSAEPVWDGFTTAPKGVLLDSRAEIVRRARLIDINAVRSHAMPPGNVTEITDEERQTLAGWLDAGAPDR